MPGITFAQLPRELRDMIWLAAAAVQYEQSYDFCSNVLILFVSITNNTATPCKVPCQPRRPYLIDGDVLVPDPNSTKSKPYVICFRHCRDQDQLRIGMNDIQTLINCLPMAAVNSEARSHATAFCRSQVKLVLLFYDKDMDSRLSGPGDGILNRPFVQPTSVMITTAHKERDIPLFDSAAHLVDVVNRVCGSGVEHIICDAWAHSRLSLEDVYWPHTLQSVQLQEDMRPISRKANFVNSLKHTLINFVMTPERMIYMEEGLRNEEEHRLRKLYHHLLKFREILDASKQLLPCLRGIELELETPNMEDVDFTNIRAEIQAGDLCVDFKTADVKFHHDWIKYIYGDRWRAFYTELGEQQQLRGEARTYPPFLPWLPPFPFE